MKRLLLTAICLTAAAGAPQPSGSKAYIAQQPPAGLTPATGLSAEQRRANFEELWKAIDTTYAHFELKKINWVEAGERYRRRLDEVASDSNFYRLLFQLVAELKDTHSGLQNYRVAPLADAADVALDRFQGRVFVVAVRPDSQAAAAGVAPGWEVLSVDGKSVAERMDSLRPHLRGYSSERAFQRDASRSLLIGESGTQAALTLRPADGDAITVQLPRGGGRRVAPPMRSPVFDITRQRFVHYGKHPSGLGYIRIESFNGRTEIADEFDTALAALRETPGLLLDIRDNPGGFGQQRIVSRLLTKRALTTISYVKRGPKHGDFERREMHIEPGGPWQYKKPIALLVNEGTGSASDLFACELHSAKRVLTVGTTTHGNLSGVAAFVVLPCGLIVRVSNGYLADASGRPIEVNGNVPDVVVEESIADFLSGRDVVLERAVAALK